MLFQEVAVFSTVFLVFAMAFGSSFFHLLPSRLDHLDVESNQTLTFNKTIWDLPEQLGDTLETALGGYNMERYQTGEYSAIASALYIVETVLVTVLLFNVLTAKMTHTIEHINDSSVSIWIIERARIMRSLVDEEGDDGWERLLEQGRVTKFWKDFDMEFYLSSASPALLMASQRIVRVTRPVRMFEVVEDSMDDGMEHGD